MSIPYEKAVQTIASVVGEKVDYEVIKMVLEANQGHMERTIEQLLQMMGEIPANEQVPASTSKSPR